MIRRRRAILSGRSPVSTGVHRSALPVDRLPDDALLAGLGSGDAETALAFVRRFQHIVFGVAVTVVGDTRLAEDVAQQAFERAWRHAGVYDARRGSVRTWLTTITRNLAIDAIRPNRPSLIEPNELVAMLGVTNDDPEQRALAGESSAELHGAIAALPPEQARAIVLAGMHGWTAREIAETEGIPLGTAKTRIRAAMGKLRGALAGRGADHG